MRISQNGSDNVWKKATNQQVITTVRTSGYHGIIVHSLALLTMYLTYLAIRLVLAPCIRDSDFICSKQSDKHRGSIHHLQ
jgi:hypothetical protein